MSLRQDTMEALRQKEEFGSDERKDNQPRAGVGDLFRKRPQA
jgi:hypothetical protein